MCMTTTSNTLYACIIFSKSKGCVNIRELSIPQKLRGAMDPGCDSWRQAAGHTCVCLSAV